MGNDGGSIATKRSDKVKTAKPEYAKTQGPSAEEKSGAVLTTCAVGKGVLAPPILCDDLGHLMTKESALSAILDKSIASILPHVRSMKLDLFPVNATAVDVKSGGGEAAPAAASAAASAGSAVGPALFQCPVTGLLANGRYQFVVLRGCGCMVSERAVKALKEESCPACGVSYGELANKETRSPIIKLALSEDEKTAALEKLLASRAAAKSEKKGGKRLLNDDCSGATQNCTDIKRAKN